MARAIATSSRILRDRIRLRVQKDGAVPIDPVGPLCYGRAQRNVMKHLRLEFLMLGLLSAGTLINCNCEEEEFLPSVTYDPFPYVVNPSEPPGTEIVFGDVSVNSEKTLAIRVQSNGRAPVNVVAANLVSSSQDGTWSVKVDDELDPMVGLTPGKTATISVTFRPCPAAWNGNELKADFDYNTCPGEG